MDRKRASSGCSSSRRSCVVALVLRARAVAEGPDRALRARRRGAAREEVDARWADGIAGDRRRLDARGELPLRPRAGPRIVTHEPTLPDGDYTVEIEHRRRERRRTRVRQARDARSGGSTSIDARAGGAAMTRIRTKRERERGGAGRPRRAPCGAVGVDRRHPGRGAVGQRQGHEPARSGRSSASARRRTTISSSPTTRSRATTASSSRDSRRRARARPRLDQRHARRRRARHARRSCARARCSRSARSSSPLRPAARNVEVLPSDKTEFGAAHRAEPRDAHASSACSSASRRPTRPCCSRARPAPARTCSRAPSAPRSAARDRGRSSSSTAARCRDSLIESELFGHERGAFTGAVAARRARSSCADGGTLFLDEIGELPLDVQPKLLRVLETREFRRVGGTKTLPVDVRVVAATNRDLAREVAARQVPRGPVLPPRGRARSPCPPLRERRDDIPLLVEHFLDERAGRRRPRRSRDETLQALMRARLAGQRARAAQRARARRSTWRSATGADGARASSRSRSPRRPRTRRVPRSSRARATARRAPSTTPSSSAATSSGSSAATAATSAPPRARRKMDRKHLHDMAKKHGLRGQEPDEMQGS